MIYSIEVRNLSFRYFKQKRLILDDISLKINKGEVVAIVGLSGSGKSTLCYCLSGIIPNAQQGEMTGEVLIEGTSTTKMTIPTIATRVGIVFQNPDTQLFFPTVEDELAFGPENLCIESEEIGKRISESLKLVGMEAFRYKSPHHLSGGQKQLIALASALTLKPEILIFDEAMSQIDKTGKKLIKDVILDLKKAGKSVIMVEHDLNNLDIADRILVLQQGRIRDFEGEL
ncbi:MAG: ABC transporter ATP-binding protein [Halanaerobiales bacterium]|nr:ABC transporter ATP-binding protein [Halanaerobiales bacterium]